MNKKLLQIDSSLNMLATGRITESIGKLAIDKGWDVYIVHGARYAKPGSCMNSLQSVSKWGEYFHFVESVLFDNHGLASRSATKKIVAKIKEIQPDVIHLHCIHGYYLNYKILFEYLNTTNIPVVWTLHDCWPFTGHCAYFDSVNCMRWKTGCFNCPLKGDYPKSLCFDRSKENYELKKSLFTKLKSCVIVPVSDWLGDITKESYLGKYAINVIHNGIDLNTFKPINTNLKKRLGIEDSKTVVLGLAAQWLPRKGYDDMIRLSQNKDLQVVMVGVNKKQKKSLPSEIISVTCTNNQQELVEYYNIADVFVNPTYSDNFPTTNIEALACGTPVITYKTGGSPEAIDENTGIVVEQGDIEGILKAIKLLKEHPISSLECRNRALNMYDKDIRFMDYINLYENLSHSQVSLGILRECREDAPLGGYYSILDSGQD